MLRAPINCGNSGSNTIVAADTAQRKIRVFAWQITCQGTVTATWQTSTGSVALTGPVYGVAGGGANSPTIPVAFRQVEPPYQFDTVAGDALILNLSGAVNVGGEVWYDLVQPSM